MKNLQQISQIRPFNTGDFLSVKRIYQQGIDTGNATFQTKAKDWNEWDNSMLPCCRLIAEVDNLIVGWGALSPTSARAVYAGVVEVSVYVDTEYSNMGLGKSLLAALIESSEANNIWTLQSSIFPENVASITIHEQLGFSVVGTREKLGQMDGVWRDVVLMERRSLVVG
jgi:phosphinothricin acetyltransferase